MSTQLSGPQWVNKFPGSRNPADCVQPFRSGLMSFLSALKDANISVGISATFRPPERAYLMHWSWRIAKNEVLAQSVPPMAGVAIDWVHRDAAGQPDDPKSRSAASQMVAGYGIVARPALTSRHTQGRAIDMDISWQGNVRVKNMDGSIRDIASPPRDGTNADLQQVGATYGVIKATFDDPPHWSDDGH